MEAEQKPKTIKKRILNFLKKPKNIALIILIILALYGLSTATSQVIKTIKTQGSDLTKIEFKDIGELATESAICTQQKYFNEARELDLVILPKIPIPFTDRVKIFTYDFDVKAGYNFADINIDPPNFMWQTITVHLPEARILSVNPIEDSQNVIYDNNNIFRDFSVGDNDECIKQMKHDAEEKAKEKGIYSRAEENAKKLIEKVIKEKNVEYWNYKIVFK